MSPTELLGEIELRLQRYPEYAYQRSQKHITVLPKDKTGFEISLFLKQEGYTLSFDGWHEEFEDAEQVLNGFAFALSKECRLEVIYRGRFPYIWTVQEVDADGEWYDCDWLGLSTTGLFFFPFWLRKRMGYLQNSPIPKRT